MMLHRHFENQTDRKNLTTSKSIDPEKEKAQEEPKKPARKPKN